MDPDIIKNLEAELTDNPMFLLDIPESIFELFEEFGYLCLCVTFCIQEYIIFAIDVVSRSSDGGSIKAWSFITYNLSKIATVESVEA